MAIQEIPDFDYKSLMDIIKNMRELRRNMKDLWRGDGVAVGGWSAGPWLLRRSGNHSFDQARCPVTRMIFACHRALTSVVKHEEPRQPTPAVRQYGAHTS